MPERIGRLGTQVEKIVIVDNGSPPEVMRRLERACADTIDWVVLSENRGIAAAQNIGIERARISGATYVLLLDQDSDPDSHMVAMLRRTADDMEARGVRFGLLAPVFIDQRRSELACFFRFVGLRMLRFGCAPGEDIVMTDAAIASGALIPLQALTEIGGMDEKLFIDLVDIEWCLRAVSRGWCLYGVCNAVLYHCLGEKPGSVFGRRMTHHGPLRFYYFFRNAVWLFRRNYVPAAWKIAVTGQLLRRYLLYPLLFKPRLDYLRMMSLGIWHGLRGQLGPLRSD